MTYVMMTVPHKYVKRGRAWLEYFQANDVHKWVFALEHGSNGLKHWQVRFKVRGCDTKDGKTAFFNVWKSRCPQAHIEFTDNWCDYERKEGNFVCSEDNREILSIRYGVPNKLQREISYTLRNQSDRQIDVWYDPSGNKGKTWFSLWLYEHGQALLVPRYCATPREISNFICSAYQGQPIIIFDIPRATRINPGLYEALEEVKDGTVYDPRYSGRMRNIRGVKLLVFTNTKLDEKKLSFDRWRLNGFGKHGKKPESPNRNTKGSPRKGRGRKKAVEVEEVFGGE